MGIFVEDTPAQRRNVLVSIQFLRFPPLAEDRRISSSVATSSSSVMTTNCRSIRRNIQRNHLEMAANCVRTTSKTVLLDTAVDFVAVVVRRDHVKVSPKHRRSVMSASVNRTTEIQTKSKTRNLPYKHNFGYILFKI